MLPVVYQCCVSAEIATCSSCEVSISGSSFCACAIFPKSRRDAVSPIAQIAGQDKDSATELSLPETCRISVTIQIHKLDAVVDEASMAQSVWRRRV